MPEHAGSTSIGYESGNALGELWQVAPKLAAKCVRLPSYAKFIQAYLRAVDFHCEKTGRSPARLRIDTYTKDGRIVQRFS